MNRSNRRELIDKYQYYLSSIVQGLDVVKNEDGDIDLKVFNRLAKVSSLAVKRSNSYIENEDLPNGDKQYWQTLKELSFSLIERLSEEMPMLLSQAQVYGNVWTYLYSFEVCMDVLNLLYNEEGIEAETETSVKLTPEQLAIIEQSIKNE